MNMTALSAEPFEVLDRMTLDELKEVAEIYGFYDLVRHLTNVETIRSVVKQQAQRHKIAAYGEEWGS